MAVWRTIRAGIYTILVGLVVTASGTVPPYMAGALIFGPLIVLMGLWVIGGGVVEHFRWKREHAAWWATMDPTYRP
jgi:hypothetical protein